MGGEMLLDFLPYKKPQKPRKEKLGVLRYIMFALSLALVSGLFLMKTAHLEKIMFWLFLAGNVFYYIAGIVGSDGAHDLLACFAVGSVGEHGHEVGHAERRGGLYPAQPSRWLWQSKGHYSESSGNRPSVSGDTEKTG